MLRYLRKIGVALLILGSQPHGSTLKDEYLARHPAEHHTRPLIILGGVLFGFGLLSMVIALGLNFQQVRTGFWPTTTGVIEVSESRRFRSGSANVQVSYSYLVNGKRYGSSRIATRDESFDDVRFAMEVADRYPVGQTVPVSYNPRNPSFAILEAGYDLMADWLFVVGLCLAVSGVGFFCMQFARSVSLEASRDPFKSPDRLP